MTKVFMRSSWPSVVLGLILSITSLATRAIAQYDNQDGDYDPPSRVARLGYIEGSVALQPAGEPDWVQAVGNRPMTTGDKLWADRDSRAELQLGSAAIRLSANTGFSFLNLDDDTVQIQLTSGAINIRVRELDRNDVFEVDTPNLAFSIYQPGIYRVEASEDGNYTVISVRAGEGESTGNGQTYTLHAGQRVTFSGTDALNADVVQIGGPDQFDRWSDDRDERYQRSRSAQYLSRDVVGYEDLDDYGDWRDDSSYGHVWFPNRVSSGWAPYREGHWEWISPWGYTWVDDEPWGYAPFHYGRWVTIGGRWGWVAGPPAVRPVYAPALVVFIGGGGGGFGDNVGWFPLGPREVYVPPYRVSERYVNRVNISNTTVNNTTVTNVYNTVIVNKTTTITNINYANRNVRGAVTAVPQRTFASAQPVGRAAVAVNPQQITAAPINTRVAVAPTRESVLGAKAITANRVTAPPPTVVNRQVIAKKTPPPPPVPFAKQQQALSAHPGQPLARNELQNLRQANNASAPHPMVKQAPPGKPAIARAGRPGAQPGNQPNDSRESQPGPPASEQASRPPNQQTPNQREAAPNQERADRPPSAQPKQAPPNEHREADRLPEPTVRDKSPQPEPRNGQPEMNPPNGRPDKQPAPEAQPNPPTAKDRPEANRPPKGRSNDRPNDHPQQNPNRARTNPSLEPQANADRSPAARRNDRPQPNRPEDQRPEPNRAEPNRPDARRNQPVPNTEPSSRNDRPQRPATPAETKPPEHKQQKAQTPEEKKQEEERRKREQQNRKENKPPSE